jgi:hypothetical protein
MDRVWGSVAAASARHHPGANQRDAEPGEHEQKRGARQDQRERLVAVAHDRALRPDDLDRGGLLMS